MLFFLGKQQLMRPKATPDQRPKEVRITNVTENSFTVSWLTEAAVSGSVTYGTSPDELKQAAIEDDAAVMSDIHSIDVRPLKPDTEYHFLIQSGNGRWDNAGVPFTVKTFKVLSTPPPPKSVYGSILPGNRDKPPERAVVYVDIPGAQPMSTSIITSTGNWALSISTARNKDGSKYIALTDANILTIYIEAGNKGHSLATVKLSQAAPVPSMALGQEYEFERLTETVEPKTATELELTKPVSETVGDKPAADKFTSGGELAPAEIKLTIDTPVENQSLADSTPTFSGQAPPETTLTLTVRSTPITSKVVTDANGRWTWTPPADLLSGQHSITLTYTDSQGKTYTETKTFIVQAATVSITPTPIPTAAPQSLPQAGSMAWTWTTSIAGILMLGLGSLLMLAF